MPYINIIEFNNSTQSILVLPWNIKALVESLYSIICYTYGANFVEWLHWEYQYPIELNNQSYHSLVIMPRTQPAKLDSWLLMKNKSLQAKIFLLLNAIGANLCLFRSADVLCFKRKCIYLNNGIDILIEKILSKVRIWSKFSSFLTKHFETKIINNRKTRMWYYVFYCEEFNSGL